MSEVVLKVENLSKQYRLGLVGTGTLSHDLNRWLHKIRGKEDPYLRVGETNDRSSKGESDYVWAIKDINFEVKEGEVLGIIGKNGAGKSTLLKILSKVTGPTTGKIKAKGRIASLLEVGTGFHPELTGKENIFLNGAMLGMSKPEVASKLDQIIEFAGIERYIDTPVKRYSSGMYVRLAFAVAAHLEPEILIVDEVLAVGDAAFQKKAIGKMKSVSQGEGRTVLFVSHDLAAIKALCTRAILLEDGMVSASGSVEDIVKKYTMIAPIGLKKNVDLKNLPRTRQCLGEIRLEEAKINKVRFSASDTIEVSVKLNSEIISNDFALDLAIVDQTDNKVFHIYNHLLPNSIRQINKGTSKFKFTIPQLRLKEGVYTINLSTRTPGIMQDILNNVLSFEVTNQNVYSENEKFILFGMYQTDFEFIQC